MTALKQAEAASGVSTRAGRPKALILGPTRELADQLLGVAKSLAHHDKFRAACLSGGELLRTLVRGRPKHIVICTCITNTMLQAMALKMPRLHELAFLCLRFVATLFDITFRNICLSQTHLQVNHGWSFADAAAVSPRSELCGI